jgi:hypothetical protein
MRCASLRCQCLFGMACLFSGSLQVNIMRWFLPFFWNLRPIAFDRDDVNLISQGYRDGL